MLLSAPATSAQDFDGDGFKDLAIGVPLEGIDGEADAGAVNVIYGGVLDPSPGTPYQVRWGLSTRDEIWSQNHAGIKGVAENGDQFGFSVAWGDFNGDGFDDLAAGAPYEGVSGEPDAGAVNVLYGNPGNGLEAVNDQIWHQDSPGIKGVPEKNDYFGWSLAAGDFNGDGYDDLAIGVPGEGVDGNSRAGLVKVLYGSNGVGLTDVRDQAWSQNSPNVNDSKAQPGDEFGYALCVGDFDGDGLDDLAIGAPGEEVSNREDAGSVNVLYGSSAGLEARSDEPHWSFKFDQIKGDPEVDDRYGAALACADFDLDGADDLAIGVPGRDIWSGGLPIDNAGSVSVLYGEKHNGLTFRDQLWDMDKALNAVLSSNHDQFGFSLATGTFRAGDAYRGHPIPPALAVGAPGANGAVVVIYSGIQGAGLVAWSQLLTDTVLGRGFGTSLMAANLVDGGPQSAAWLDDLVVGIPGAEVNQQPGAGIIRVFSGTTHFGLWQEKTWSQHTTGIKGKAEDGDGFGAALVR